MRHLLILLSVLFTACSNPQSRAELTAAARAKAAADQVAVVSPKSEASKVAKASPVKVVTGSVTPVPEAPIAQVFTKDSGVQATSENTPALPPEAPEAPEEEVMTTGDIVLDNPAPADPMPVPEVIPPVSDPSLGVVVRDGTKFFQFSMQEVCPPGKDLATGTEVSHLTNQSLFPDVRGYQNLHISSSSNTYNPYTQPFYKPGQVPVIAGIWFKAYNAIIPPPGYPISNVYFGISDEPYLGELLTVIGGPWELPRYGSICRLQ